MTKTPKECEELCKECTLCCEYITVEIGTPKTKEDLDEIRWFLLHDVEVFIDEEDKWRITVYQRCEALGNDGKCKIYDQRPIVCRNYSYNECEKYKGKNYGEKATFKTVEEFLDYVKNHPIIK